MHKTQDSCKDPVKGSVNGSLEGSSKHLRGCQGSSTSFGFRAWVLGLGFQGLGQKSQTLETQEVNNILLRVPDMII